MAVKKNNSTYISANITGNVKNVLFFIAQATDAERQEGMSWYCTAHRDAVTLATETGIDLWAVCQVLSIISPQRKWERNIQDCKLAIQAHALAPDLRIPFLSSHKVSAPSGWVAFERAWSVLDGTFTLQEKGSPKTFNFAQTIYNPDTWMGVSVDSHAVALWSDMYHLVAGAYQIPLSVYRRCAADYELAGAMMGILPSQAQAIAWVVRRRLLSDTGSPI